MKRRSRPKAPPKELRELWARVPKVIDCQRKCAASCGPIGCTEKERSLIEERSGRVLRSEGSRRDCSMLKGDRCTVYSIRPLICRLWGVVESMSCPHGCKPERTLTDQEGLAIMAEAADLYDDDDMNIFREAIKSMTPEAWDAYRRFVSSSIDLGNEPLTRRQAVADLVKARERWGAIG